MPVPVILSTPLQQLGSASAALGLWGFGGPGGSYPASRTAKIAARTRNSAAHGQRACCVWSFVTFLLPRSQTEWLAKGAFMIARTETRPAELVVVACARCHAFALAPCSLKVRLVEGQPSTHT